MSPFDVVPMKRLDVWLYHLLVFSYLIEVIITWLERRAYRKIVKRNSK